MADANDPRLGGGTLEAILYTMSVPFSMTTSLDKHGEGSGAVGLDGWVVGEEPCVLKNQRTCVKTWSQRF
jgi:hypothetical protein